MGNFVYLKYTKLWKSVYLKYTKLHCRNLQADEHCSCRAVFTGHVSLWAAPAPDPAPMPALGTPLRGDGAPSAPT